jgi:hypothetical protein
MNLKQTPYHFLPKKNNCGFRQIKELRNKSAFTALFQLKNKQNNEIIGFRNKHMINSVVINV